MELSSVVCDQQTETLADGCVKGFIFVYYDNFHLTADKKITFKMGILHQTNKKLFLKKFKCIKVEKKICWCLVNVTNCNNAN